MTRLRMLVALVALVPALAGLVAVGAAADRVDGVGSVPAAVVNADQMAALPDGTPLPAGRLLTAELTDPVDGQLQFNWEIVPADVAATGLAGGDYYAVVTIPEGFSQSIVDMLGGTAQPAQITLEASDPASPLMARVSAEVTQAAADTLGRFFTEEYLAGTLNGSTQLHDAMAQAADGASQLEDGALLASDGALQLSTGSDQLADGLGLLSDGAGQASAGADQLADGADQLADGAVAAAAGADQLDVGAFGVAGGARQVDTGAGQLADGASGLRGGLLTYSDGMTTLADGSSDLVTGANALADGASELADGTRLLSDSLTGLATDSLGIDIDTLLTAVGDSLTLAQQAVDGLASLQSQWDTWMGTLPTYDDVVEQVRTAYSGAVAEQCVAATSPDALAICEQLAAVQIPGSAELNAQLDAALAALKEQLAQIPTGNPDYPTLADVLEAAETASGDIAAALPTLDDVDAFLANARTLVDQAPAMLEGVEALADGADALASGASDFADGLTQFDTGVGQLADGAGQLSAGASQLSEGASALHGGTSLLSGGATQLADGMSSYAAGAGQLADGTVGLASGAGQLADGVAQVADGAGQSAYGASQLADGAGQLSSGITELAGGTGDLADGLQQGADQIPVYTEAEAAALAATLVRPIGVSETGVATGAAASWSGFAPTISVIVLWLGALATYLVLEAVPTRRRFAVVGPTGLAWSGLWPGVALGAAQATMLMVVLGLGGVRFAAPMTALVVALASAGAFAAVHHGLVAAFGRKAGLTVSLLFGVLQAALLTTLMPATTVPELLRPLAGVLPMGIAADGLTAGVLGGSAVSVGGVLLGLGVWAALGFAMGIVGARRRQAVSVDELRTGIAVAA